MTKKQILALISDKTEEMNGYIAIKETLETNLETITNTMASFDENIYTPIAAPYPLEGEGGEDWAGDNEVEAAGLNGDISSVMGTYEGDVNTLSGEISQDIADLAEKISELEEEIKELQEALLTAPDEEPESSSDGGSSSGGGGGGTSYTAVM